jgi:hypothetical protein
MGVELTTVDPPRHEAPWLHIPSEAILYFTRVAYALRLEASPLDLDICDKTIWGNDELERVGSDCRATTAFLERRCGQDEHLGDLEPPLTVDEESDPEPFGRAPALELLGRVELFARDARREGSIVFAWGD